MICQEQTVHCLKGFTTRCKALIPPFMKKILAKKEKVPWRMRDKSTSKKEKYNTTLTDWKQELMYDLQNETSHPPSIATNRHYTFSISSNTSQQSLVVAKSSFFTFHYVLFNQCPSFIFHDFTFYSKIAVRPISNAARTSAAKFLWPRCLW